jgi:hypothetical protein
VHQERRRHLGGQRHTIKQNQNHIWQYYQQQYRDSQRKKKHKHVRALSRQ